MAMLIPGQRVHFVGIGGIGMSAIARVMLQQGYLVSGSDRKANAMTQALERAGVTIFEGHRAEQVGEAEALIISSAIPADNPEVQFARQHGIPVLKRVDMLGDLMVGHTGIAVAGTHGKTTTTSMIVHILLEAGLDPTYIVGGIVSSTGHNAGVGRGAAFVIEADEYDHMFLGLRPEVGVITSIEHDHPDLFPTLGDLVNEFNQFAALVPEKGLLVVCADDPIAITLGYNRKVLQWPVITYGLNSPHADWRATDWQPNNIGGMNFTLGCEDAEIARVILRVPGTHNVANALAALIVVDYLGVSLADALAALVTFTGASRRFEVRGTTGGVTVIDDYAHHPTAIRLTLEAAKATYPGACIWAVWQPHTYSRLRALFNDFADAFPASQVDHVLITDVYAARETLSEGPGVPDLIARMEHPDVRHTPGFADAVEALAAGVKPGDVVLILSAGDAPQIGVDLLDRLAR
jgi:UDP-N-acetylmuramate--alanine ligase